MGVEIERKFLVLRDELPRRLPRGISIEQGFLCSSPVVRIRLVHDKRRAFVTIKGNGTRVRAEFEYPLPFDDAKKLLKLCGPTIAKVRRRIGRFEVDEFKGRHEGLWVAECELCDAREELPPMPPWIGREVTDDPRYANVNLAGSIP